jgi:hypothetical protein
MFSLRHAADVIGFRFQLTLPTADARIAAAAADTLAGFSPPPFRFDAVFAIDAAAAATTLFCCLMPPFS